MYNRAKKLEYTGQKFTLQIWYPEYFYFSFVVSFSCKSNAGVESKVVISREENRRGNEYWIESRAQHSTAAEMLREIEVEKSEEQFYIWKAVGTNSSKAFVERFM